MDRDRLVGMLHRDGGAFEACRRMLVAGARYWVDEDTVPASALATIYARRDRLTRRKGIQSLGFTEAVETLRSRGDDPICIGAVDTDDPPYHFQLFLDEGATTVVACLGVDQSWKTHVDEPGQRTIRRQP
ncbi:hypothetical protein GCM10009557_15500 [Virgisporangium ochraceum]|uniref:Uncharacterized protein n=1 Tax=Virgisporangium ochraceum TaxID=65505 RepID=A0A8J4EAV6_9ACTN|nr:hypothetical protein [Virgisporangium ochraceum]GIJ67944.1 hypothetical protein Voc01_028610 [Virgisporangium ochraceum]